MLQIFGSDISYPCNKVRITANACGIPYEYKRVDMRKGENKTPEFLAMNPVGKVPAINDDGFTLFESNAIVRYLAQKGKPELYPADPKKRAVVDQWMDFVSQHVGAALGKVMYNRVFYKIIGDSVDERSLKDGLAWIERYLPIVDAQLKKGRYIAGAELSIADLNLVASLDPAEVAGIDLSKYPNIVRWRTEMMGQKFYKDCHSSFSAAFQQMQ